MQTLSNLRRLTCVLKPPPIHLTSARDCTSFLAHSRIQITIAGATPLRCADDKTVYSFSRGYFQLAHHPAYSNLRTSSFSTDASSPPVTETAPTESKAETTLPVDVEELLVKEVHGKILESINIKRTMSPNSWLWLLIEKCENHDHIKLLFNALQELRRFRLSNLRIHANFNCNLCQEVTRACARAGAIEFGKKALWKHNVYGLTPSIASANHLLSYAENHKDIKLMVAVMKLLQMNHISLQPGTADIVFRTCYNSDNWELISKYSKKFLKAGVQLRKTSFETWMDFAAKRGDIESLWKIEKLRSETKKPHTLKSGFSCVKGLILERKPEDAAAVIQLLNQTLPEPRKADVVGQLQNLVSEWPLDVVKLQPKENRKPLVTALKSDIPAMITVLLHAGLEVNVNLEDLTSKGITF